MPIIKNICAGERGAYLKGALIMVAPGSTAEADDFPAEWFGVIEGGAPDLFDMTIADLKALANAENIDLGDATKKGDIVTAIELAREVA